MWKRGKLAFTIFSTQVFLLVLLVLRSKYGNEANANHQSHNYAPALGGQEPEENSIGKEVARLMDSFKLLFLVFGLSISFTKNYLHSGPGLNFLLSFIVIQVSLVCQLFHRSHIIVDVYHLKLAIQTAVSCLLTTMSLHGKMSSLQLLWLVVLHSVIYEITSNITSNFQIHEISPGMKVIGFGSFFGLTVSVGYTSTESQRSYKLETSVRSQFLFVVSIILAFLFWPPFLSGSSYGDKRHRIFINALLSMMGGTIAAFAVSSLADEKNKFTAVSS